MRIIACVLSAAILLAVPALAKDMPRPVVDHGGTRFVFDMRLASGLAWKQMNGEGHWGYPVDALALFRIDIGGTGNTIMPELGYSGSLHFDADIQSHYFVGGVGYGFSSEWFTAGIVPSIVAGVTQDFDGNRGDGLGVRATLFAEVPRIVGVQMTYQSVASGGVLEHQVMFTASLNAALIVVWALLAR